MSCRAFTVKKNGGSWYVYCGLEIVSLGYATRADAISKRKVIAHIVGVPA